MFWSYIKSLRKDTGGIAPLKDNGRLHADSKEKADILNRQYESTWTREDKTSIPVPDGNPFPSMKDIHVTKEGITKLLQKLNPGKASRPDLLPARILKELAEELSPYLTAIFQRSFDTGIVPKDWRTANVTAILRKGKSSRPATIDLSLSPVYAVRYRNMWSPAMSWNTWKAMISYGFRARRSCETQLVTLAQELLAGLDKKHQHDLFGLFQSVRQSTTSTPDEEAGPLWDKRKHLY